MLGKPHTPIVIEEPYASEMRDRLRRYRKGEFTDEEKKQIERSKKILAMGKVEWIS